MKFFDFYQTREEGKLYFCYRTHNTVYEERLAEGQLQSVYWNGAGFDPHTVTNPCSPRLNPADYHVDAAFGLWVDGTDLSHSYRLEGVSQTTEKDGLHITVSLTSTLKAIRVGVHTLLDGSNILVRYLTVENLGEQVLSLSRVTVMSGAVMCRNLPSPYAEPPFEIGYIHNAMATFEGDFQWQKLPRNTFGFGKKRYAERYRNPFFAVRSLQSPDLFMGQLAFSGGYEFLFHNLVECHSQQDFLSFEIATGEKSPVYVLTPGEQMTSPSFHGALLHGDFDAAVQEFHRHIRQYCGVFEKHALLEASIGPEVAMDEANVFAAMDTAAEVGAEVFFIDAGWYAPDGGERCWPEHTGDWFPDPWRYACSMHDFKAYANQKGMKFGLWMDIEKLGPKSAALQNPAVPKLHGYNGALTPDGQSGILDLSHPRGFAWAFEQICRCIDQYELTFFRLDSGAYSYTSCDECHGFRENRDLRYYANLYRLFAQLREKYPHVVFQNCAGGGGRLDLGMMKPMSNTWISDCQVAPLSFSVINGVTAFLPPEYTVRPIGAQSGHREGTLDFQMNVVRFSNPLFSYCLPKGVCFPPEQLERIKKMFHTYKTVLRPMMRHSRVFHHTPTLDPSRPDCVGILEMAGCERDCSLLGIFTLSQVCQPQKTVRFRGVDAVGLYDIYINDEYCGQASGYDLVHTGLTVMMERPLDSKAILVRQVKTCEPPAR